MKEFWIYTLARIGLFLACGVVIFSAWMLIAHEVNLLAVIVISAVVSLALSWKLLEGPRNRFAESVDQRARNASQRFEELKSKEDDD